MSDLSDVLSLLASQCAGYVYPQGTAQPSVTGGAVRVFAGWPASASLDVDLQAGVTNVSIFPAGPEKNTTRYTTAQHVMSIAPATLILKQNGSVITVGGAMPSPFTMHNMAVVIANQPFVYPVQPTDTLTTIATGLAGLIAGQYPGTVNNGAVITLPSGVVPDAVRVGTSGSIGTEWERQQQRIQITVWAAKPTARAQVASAIKTALAQMSFLTMVDGFGANIKSGGGLITDSLEKARTFRRDLFYDVEYATTTSASVATIVAVKAQYQTQGGIPITSTTN